MNKIKKLKKRCTTRSLCFHKGGVVDSHIGGGVLSPEISLQSCE